MAIKPIAQTWPQPDFMPAPERPGAWVWAWLLLVSCGLVGLGLQWQSLQQQRALLTEQAGLLSRLGEADLRAGSSAGSKQTLANAADLQRRAWALAGQLNPRAGEDWASRWAAVEQALPPGLQLLALEMEGATMRLEGLSPQADLVMQLVDRLALQAAGVERADSAHSPDSADTGKSAASEVVLTRLQRPEAAEESNSLRFEVVRRRATGLRS